MQNLLVDGNDTPVENRTFFAGKFKSTTKVSVVYPVTVFRCSVLQIPRGAAVTGPFRDDANAAKCAATSMRAPDA